MLQYLKNGKCQTCQTFTFFYWFRWLAVARFALVEPLLSRLLATSCFLQWLAIINKNVVHLNLFMLWWKKSSPLKYIHATLVIIKLTTCCEADKLEHCNYSHLHSSLKMKQFGLCSHFGDNVNTAEQQLVKMSALHQVSTVNHNVLKTSPYFPT